MTDGKRNGAERTTLYGKDRLLQNTHTHTRLESALGGGTNSACALRGFEYRWVDLATTTGCMIGGWTVVDVYRRLLPVHFDGWVPAEALARYTEWKRAVI